MIRSGYLERHKGVNRKRSKPRRTTMWRSPEYVNDVRETQPCAARHFPGHLCGGRRTFSHLGVRPGAGMKCHDYEGAQMCWDSHAGWEFNPPNVNGRANPFYDMNREERHRWAAARIAETQAAMVARGWALPL